MSRTPTPSFSQRFNQLLDEQATLQRIADATQGLRGVTRSAVSGGSQRIYDELGKPWKDIVELADLVDHRIGVIQSAIRRDAQTLKP